MSIKKEGTVELTDESLGQVTGGGASEEIACGGRTVEDSMEKLFDAPQGKSVQKGNVANTHFKDIPLSKIKW